MQEAIEAPRPFAEYVDELERYYGGERPSRASGEDRPTAVRWIGDHKLATSLSIVNQRSCEQLDARSGIAVERVERDGTRNGSPIPHAADVEVRHQWPPDLRPASSGRLAVIQPWEFGAVPREWIEKMRANADEVWVPSEFVRGMYVSSGLDPERVHVVPNGVDLDRFRPDGPSLEYRRHDIDLTGTWVASGASTIDARLSFGRQRYEDNSARDFSGTTGSLQWRWKPTGKLNFYTVLLRDTGTEAGLFYSGVQLPTGGSALLTQAGDTSRVTTLARVQAEYEF